MRMSFESWVSVTSIGAILLSNAVLVEKLTWVDDGIFIVLLIPFLLTMYHEKRRGAIGAAVMRGLVVGGVLGGVLGVLLSFVAH
jgi:hypothetical protein